MNFFDQKDVGNRLLKLCPKVVKHPVYIYLILKLVGKGSGTRKEGVRQGEGEETDKFNVYSIISEYSGH
jgi:hypothetical protein